MSKKIAVAGKGGTGKTTFSALMIRHLTEVGDGPILAVDADPNSNLNELLGITVESTIGRVREEILEKKDSIPAGMSKQQWVEYQIREILVEEDEFDLITMGRSEGPGCYCYINNLLRDYMDTLSDNYEFTVIDNEAGMEHLSRRTTRSMDMLFLVSDRSRVGITAAARIKELASEIGIRVGNICLVVNRCENGIPGPLASFVEEAGFSHVETVPFDPAVEEASMSGASVFNLSADSVSLKTVKEMAARYLEVGG